MTFVRGRSTATPSFVVGGALLLAVGLLLVTLVQADNFQVNVAVDGEDADGCGIGSKKACRSIKMALSVVAEGGQVIVNQGTYLGSKNTNLHIPKKVTIRGAFGSAVTIIQCAGNLREQVFLAQGLGSLYIKGFTIRDCSSGGSSGGAFSFTDIPLVNVYDVNFHAVAAPLSANHQASKIPFGGAIYAIRSRIVAYNIHVSDASATHGGAIYLDGDRAHSSLFERSTFTNCRAEKGATDPTAGGVLLLKGSASASFINCTFSRSSADLGGAFFVQDTAHLELHGCNVSHASASTKGGCFHVDDDATVLVDTSVLQQCAASQEGGGAYLTGTTPQLTIRGSLVQYNSAHTASVISIKGGQASLVSSRVYDNTGTEATTYVTQGALIVDQTHFARNSAQEAAVMKVMLTGSTTVTDSDFTGHSDHEKAAVWIVGPGTASFSNCTFVDNHAATSSVFRVGTVSNPPVSFTSCQFRDNTASIQAAVGSVEGEATVNFDKCEFVNNRAVEHAGALNVESQAVAVVTRSQFIGNQAGQQGGALQVSSELECSRCEFDGNKAARGGAVYFLEQNTAIGGLQCNKVFRHTRFLNNVASWSGGAVYWSMPEPLCSTCANVSGSLSTSANWACEFLNNSALQPYHYGADEGYEVHHVSLNRLSPGRLLLNDTQGEATGVGVYAGQTFSVEASVRDFYDKTVRLAVDHRGAALRMALSVSVTHPSKSSSAMDWLVYGARKAQVSVWNWRRERRRRWRPQQQVNCSNVHVYSATTDVKDVRVGDDGISSFHEVAVHAPPGQYQAFVDTVPSTRSASFNVMLKECPLNYFPIEDAGEGGGACPSITCHFVAPLTEESFSKPMRSGLLSAAVISICVICVLGVFVVKKRNEKLVEAAQLPFCVCVLAGAMLSLLFVSVSFQYPPTQSQCEVEPWLGHLGFVFMFVPLVCKLLLVQRNNPRFSRRLHNKDLRLSRYMPPALLFAMVYLALWTEVGDPHPAAIKQTVGSGDNERTHEYIVCQSSSGIFGALSVSVEAMLVLFGVALSLKTGHVRTMFNERAHIAAAFYMALLVIVICLPLGYASKDKYERTYALLNGAVAAMSGAVLLAVYAPMLYRLTCGFSEAEYESQDDEDEISLPDAYDRTASEDGTGSPRYSVGSYSDYSSDDDEHRARSSDGALEDEEDETEFYAHRYPPTGLSPPPQFTGTKDSLNEEIAHLQAANAALADGDIEVVVQNGSGGGMGLFDLPADEVHGAGTAASAGHAGRREEDDEEEEEEEELP